MKPHNHPDISKEMPPAQHLPCCLYHLSWKVVKMCIFLDRGGKLVRDKRASRSSLMALSFLHILTHKLACPVFTMAETSLAVPFSPLKSVSPFCFSDSLFSSFALYPLSTCNSIRLSKCSLHSSLLILLFIQSEAAGGTCSELLF